MIDKLLLWATVAGGALLALFGVYLTGRSTGKTKADAANAVANAAEQVAEQQAVTKVQVETVGAANEVSTRINTMPDGAALTELRDKWNRTQKPGSD